VLGITGPLGCDGLELMNMFMLSRNPTHESAQAKAATTTVADKLLIAGLRMRCAPLASSSIDVFYKTREAVEQEATEVLLRRCLPSEPNSFFYRKIFRPTHASSEELKPMIRSLPFPAEQTTDYNLWRASHGFDHTECAIPARLAESEANTLFREGSD
jgi:hypothetical protein